MSLETGGMRYEPLCRSLEMRGLVMSASSSQVRSHCIRTLHQLRTTMHHYSTVQGRSIPHAETHAEKPPAREKCSRELKIGPECSQKKLCPRMTSSFVEPTGGKRVSSCQSRWAGPAASDSKESRERTSRRRSGWVLICAGGNEARKSSTGGSARRAHLGVGLEGYSLQRHSN